LITDTGDTTMQLAGVTAEYLQTLLNACTILKEGVMDFSQPESCLVDADTAENFRLKQAMRLRSILKRPPSILSRRR